VTNAPTTTASTSAPTSARTSAPTSAPPQDHHKLEQTSNFAHLSLDGYTEFVQLSYNAGWGAGCNIYDMALAQWLGGAIASSKAKAARRQNGIAVTFTASVPPTLIAAAQQGAADLQSNPGAFIQHINTATTQMKASGQIPANVTVAVPNVNEISVQAAEVSVPPAVVVPSSSSSSSMSTTLIIIIAASGGAVLLIAAGGLIYYFMSGAPQKEGGVSIAQKMDRPTNQAVAAFVPPGRTAAASPSVSKFAAAEPVGTRAMTPTDAIIEMQELPAVYQPTTENSSSASSARNCLGTSVARVC